LSKSNRHDTVANIGMILLCTCVRSCGSVLIPSSLAAPSSRTAAQVSAASISITTPTTPTRRASRSKHRAQPDHRAVSEAHRCQCKPRAMEQSGQLLSQTRYALRAALASSKYSTGTLLVGQVQRARSAYQESLNLEPSFAIVWQQPSNNLQALAG
jgi:hypothetical protein